MAKIVTKKSQIPKSAQKKIKNFTKLTDNQAILQYELNKLKRRLSKQVDYTKFIKTPKAITKSFIQEIHNIRGKQVEKFKERFASGKPLTSYEERKAKQYERATKGISKELDRISDDEIYDYEPYYPEPDDTIDINDLIEQEKQYDSVKDYLEETGQAINPFTGEVLEEGAVANIIESAKELLDDLREFVLQEIDRSIVSNSSYRNGRTRSSKSRDWIERNINNAGDMILKEIDRIKSSDSSIKDFADKFSDSTMLQSLYDAISEYLASAYYVVGNAIGSNFQASQVYSLLHDGPMTLADTMEFEDEE